MNNIDAALWSTIQDVIPIVCVDVILARRDTVGKVTQVGLIRRYDAAGTGTTWCQIGGRVVVGESLADALHRHLTETVALDLRDNFGADPQPTFVQQYFRTPGLHPALPDAGIDSRKHAVALAYLVTVTGPVRAVAGSEGLEFAWFNVEQLTALTNTWPGTMQMLRRMLAVDSLP